MPLYEYQCEKCGSLFEVLQKYSDPVLTIHEGCGGKVDKQISASGFQLKGTGWYVTDYGKGNSKAEAASKPAPTSEGKSESKAGESSTKSESNSSSESKSDSKSESKSESKAESKPAPAAKPD
jgi:putative FmdB family regulatory protein